MFSTDEIQAYRQFTWFTEVFGGPGMFDDGDNDQGEQHYLPRTMAQHTKRMMTLEHTITWLTLMNQAVHEEFSNDDEDAKLVRALSLYWLHFLAMFSYTDDERRQFRKLVMNGDLSAVEVKEAMIGEGIEHSERVEAKLTADLE